jgi:hypothetical protein
MAILRADLKLLAPGDMFGVDKSYAGSFSVKVLYYIAVVLGMPMVFGFVWVAYGIFSAFTNPSEFAKSALQCCEEMCSFLIHKVGSAVCVNKHGGEPRGPIAAGNHLVRVHKITPSEKDADMTVTEQSTSTSTSTSTL